MRFSAQEEYGLRCMVRLARTTGRSPVTIHQIAEAEKLTSSYVGKLLRILRREGLVESLHGPAGGYRLPRPANEMTAAEILNALGGRLFKREYCGRYPGEQSLCVHSAACPIRSLWAGLDLIVERILARTLLRDLAQAERPLSEWIHAQIPAVLEAAAGAPDHLPAETNHGGGRPESRKGRRG